MIIVAHLQEFLAQLTVTSTLNRLAIASMRRLQRKAAATIKNGLDEAPGCVGCHACTHIRGRGALEVHVCEVLGLQLLCWGDLQSVQVQVQVLAPHLVCDI